ncbi:MAG: 30S ribosomal protein S9 [Parcubacteria group bacterium]
MAIKKTTVVKTVKAKAPAKTEKIKEVKEVKEAKEVKTAKAAKEVKTAKETKEFSGKYFYAVGKRKTSIAQIRLYPADKAGKGIVVNGKDVKNYFTIERHSDMLKAPLMAAGLEEKFDVSVKVNGGGIMGQAEAARLGVARALIIFDENLKKSLKDLGYLTRDARIVERKKPGRRKARRSPQWAKR